MKNPGYQSDAIFHRLDGEVADHGDHFLIRTPSNPTYHWGNYLLFKSPPSSACYQKWMDHAHGHFGQNPGHLSFGWDCEEKGDPSDFLLNGFTLNQRIVLSLTSPPRTTFLNPAFTVRKFATTDDWQASIELKIDEGCEGVNEADFRIFKIDQVANHRRNQERGRGHWWGAFLENELIGDMGLYFDEEEKIGRFQDVGTATAHRRQGVCTTLLNTIIRRTFKECPVEKLIIVTDQGSIAESIYRSVGFEEEAHQFGLCKC